MKSAIMAPRIAAAVAMSAALGACQVVPQNGAQAPAPVPTPVPAPAPVPQAPPVTSQSNLDWEVAPVEAGRWTYQGADQRAVFGPASGRVHAMVTCAADRRQLTISFPHVAASARALTLRTTYGVLQWPAAPSASGTGLAVTRPANEPGLDWIAYSRGRIAVEVDGQRHMVLPTASEIGRVVEDCRS